MLKTNKRGAATIGDYVVGMFLFLFILIAGFAAYSGTITDYDSPVETSFNQSRLDVLYSDASAISDTALNKSQETPSILGLDILITGLDTIKTGFSMLAVGEEAATFVREETIAGQLPDVFWGTFTIIIILTAIFITIGTIWRYRMKK